MLTEATNNAGGSSNNWSRVCDMCRSAACILYCRADSAYLCSGCDARIHSANIVASRHERVWVCEACERAPAAFLCKADAAALCSACDADIHSANPLASHHHRLPILPISGSAFLSDGDGCQEDHHEFNCDNNTIGCEEEEDVGTGEEGDDEAEAASWLLPHPVKSSNDEDENENESNHEFLFCGGEGDVYLDLMDHCNNSCGGHNNNNNQFGVLRHHHHDGGDNHQQQHQNYRGVVQGNRVVGFDSVVPVQCCGGGEETEAQQQFQQGLDFDSSKAALSYNGSISQSVSISSLEVGVVPESTFSDVSISLTKPPQASTMGTSDHMFPPMPMPSLLTPMDREARVLRYREKKKTRKFE